MTSESCSGAAVEEADHVGAVVHRHLRMGIAGRVDVLVVGLVVLALDGEGRDPVGVDERGGDVVLGRERIGGAERDRRRRP